MNGTKAKSIRKKVYGDQSLKQPRSYLRKETTGQIINHPSSLRAKYLRAKKES
jgi:hypothetical protein